MSSVSNAVGRFLYSATRRVFNAVTIVGKSITRRVKSLVNGNGKNGSATRKSQSAEKRASALKAASNKNHNNSNSAAKRAAALSTAYKAIINGRPPRLNLLGPENQAAVIALSQMPRRIA